MPCRAFRRTDEGLLTMEKHHAGAAFIVAYSRQAISDGNSFSMALLFRFRHQRVEHYRK